MHNLFRQKVAVSPEKIRENDGLWWITLKAEILSVTGVRIPPGTRTCRQGPPPVQLSVDNFAPLPLAYLIGQPSASHPTTMC